MKSAAGGRQADRHITGTNENELITRRINCKSIIPVVQ